MEVFHWLANLPVRRYRRPPPGGYLVQWPPRHSCSQRSDDVDPVYWGLLYKLIWEDAERGKCVGPCSCTASVHSCQWRQAEWLDLHVSLNVVVLNSLYACFWVWCSGQTTVSYGKSFCGCFCLGSCPFLCVWFAVSFDETQVWLGDLRVVWLACVMVGLLWFACISGPFRSLYKWRFYCLCSCKDRASVRHRPYSRKKNTHGLYTDALVATTRTFEAWSRQSTPERSLRCLPWCILAFRKPCCWFLQLLSFSPPFNLLGQWAWPYRVWRQSPWICVVFVWCGSGPVLFRCFSAGEIKSGRKICGSSLLPLFVFSRLLSVFRWCASVVKPKSFIFLAHFFAASWQDRALERDPPQQRKKNAHLTCQVSVYGHCESQLHHDAPNTKSCTVQLISQRPL